MPGNWQKIGRISGRDGIGVPVGGTQGEVLVKLGGTDYATGWGRITYEDIEGKVPADAMPDISIEPYVVDSEAAMLNLPAVAGRMAIRTDVGKTFVLAQEPANVLANWVELVTSSDVQSVNGKTGNVVLTKADVGLANVNNTSDTDKPLATGSVRGLMPPEHFLLLDGATSARTPDTVMKRDANGRTKVEIPTDNYDAANKGYVDQRVTAQLGDLQIIRSDTDPGNPSVNRVWIKPLS